MKPISDRDSVFENVELRGQFAPVRRLADGVLAATEFQVRGHQRSALGTADSLRRAARMMQQSEVIDRRKLLMASSESAAAGANTVPVVITVDLDSIDLTADAEDLLDSASPRVLVTVQPDAVLSNPRETLARIDRIRDAGYSICVDGLGLTTKAMTLLWLVEPDVILTAPELLQRTRDPEIAQLAHALAAHVERTHALVIAEGVDTEAMRVAAQTVGATYGIGDLFPPVVDHDVAGEPVEALPEPRHWTRHTEFETTPYNIVRGAHTPRRGDKRLLIEMSKALEAQAAAAGPGMLILGTFQHARHFTTLTARRWRSLADQAGLAGVYGVGLSSILDGNVQHAPLDADDDLVNEWTVVVLGPHSAALLSARDCYDEGPDLDRTFDVVQSYDRDITTRAAYSILGRFTVPVDN